MGIVKVEVKTASARAALTKISKQVPFAAAVALNDLAQQVRKAENAAMSQVFEHPRPFTQNAVLAGGITRATKSSLVATIAVRPEVAKYLLPYEVGGVHTLPDAGNTLLNPKDVSLDTFGQIRRNTTTQLSGRKDVFVGPITTRNGTVINGFWQQLDVNRKGNARRKRAGRGTIYDAVHGALRLLIRFGDALPVKKHLNFEARADALVEASAGRAFGVALAKAIASAK
jgi:hypothetical protein